MKIPTRHLLAAAAALALNGCAGGEPTSVPADAPGGIRRYDQPSAVYSIFQSRIPAATATPDTALEYGIRFKTSLQGKVTGFRVWARNSSSITFTLRGPTGTRTKVMGPDPLMSADSSGWRVVHLSPTTYIGLAPEVWYRVSVQSQAPLGRTPGFFASGPFVNNMLTADQGFTLVRSSPTNIVSTSDAWFVDVIFQPEPV